MTATVDLLVLRLVRGAEEVPIYEPSWLFVSYADTSGLWKPYDAPEEFRNHAKGQIIDAMFGDGPKRYGLKSARPVSLVEYQYGKQTRLIPDTETKDGVYHYVTRCDLTDYLQMKYKNKHDSVFQAFSLTDFAPFVAEVIRTTDSQYENEQTKGMNGYLQTLAPERHLLLPIIGQGLHQLSDLIYSVCGFRGGILDARLLDARKLSPRRSIVND